MAAIRVRKSRVSVYVSVLLVPLALVPIRSHAGADAAPGPGWPAPGTRSGTSQAQAPVLLAYAASEHFPPVLTPEAQAGYRKRVRQIEATLARDPPPQSNCAQTLGAKRFATLYDDLGQVYSELGEDRAAADAQSRAIACNPRADYLHAELAATFMGSGQYAQARLEAERQLTLGRGSFALYSLATEVDYIDERWSETAEHARQSVAAAPSDDQATYWQCFLWLAQLHSGVAQPVLIKRHATEAWPTPILESLQGKLTQEQLLDAVKAESDPDRRRDMLVEALFYTGEQRRASHQDEEAVRYLAAVVKLDVYYFIEHHLATAELRRLRQPVPAPGDAPGSPGHPGE